MASAEGHGPRDRVLTSSAHQCIIGADWQGRLERVGVIGQLRKSCRLCENTISKNSESIDFPVFSNIEVMQPQEPLAGRITLELDRSDIGILFQDDALLPWRTVRDNAALGLRARGWERARRVDEAEAWLRRVGLTGLGDRYPGRLSGGQRMRAALTQVLVLKPRLILMDEPFSALDAIVRHRIYQDLLGLVEREGIAVLLVTHDLE